MGRKIDEDRIVPRHQSSKYIFVGRARKVDVRYDYANTLSSEEEAKASVLKRAAIILRARNMA